MKCQIITPQAAIGPTSKALSEGHRASDCPECTPLQYDERKGADQKAGAWPPGRSGDDLEGVGDRA